MIESLRLMTFMINI